MPYDSRVYRILIASPSDVDEEREITTRIIQDWNDLNSFNKKIVLLPIRWETHSHPTFGVRPQDAINKQIVDDCDLLIGFFWTRLGTPTGEDTSGTIEEIKRVSKAGKPVMLYFSKKGKDPSQIDISQLQALNNFKNEVYKSALVEEYSSSVDFRDKVSRQLEMKIRELQENIQSNKELVSLSFIDLNTGSLTNNKLNLEVERIEVGEEQIRHILKTDKRVEKKQWTFNNELVSTVNKKNNIPILIGIENITNRILSNVTAEIKLNCSVEDGLIIQFINSSDNNVLNQIDEFDLSKENESSIRKLFKSNLTQTSSKIWEYRTKQFNLLPNKLTVFDAIFLLYPKESQTIDFQITVFSDNILQPIEKECNLNIKTKNRKIKDEEITEIIERSPEDDELPF